MLADMQDNLRKAQGYVEQMKSIISELKEAHMYVVLLTRSCLLYKDLPAVVSTASAAS